MVASGFFVSRASRGKAGGLSMAGCRRARRCSSFSRVIPGGATVFRTTSARASDADFRVSMQGGNMSLLAEAPDAEIGGACLAAKDLFNVTSFRGSPPFLSSLLSSHRALPAPRASRHLARLWRAVPRLHPRRPRLRFKFFRAPDFAPPGSSFPRARMALRRLRPRPPAIALPARFSPLGAVFLLDSVVKLCLPTKICI